MHGDVDRAVQVDKYIDYIYRRLDMELRCSDGEDRESFGILSAR